MSETVSITIAQEQDYRFVVDFGAGWPELLADEPPPLGSSGGPAPTHLLLASIANCLCASLLFACRKFRNDPGPITGKAALTVDRSAEGRLRVARIEVALRLGRNAVQLPDIESVLARFEPFCTVTESVRAGIPVQVTVTDASGTVLHGEETEAPALG